MCYGSLYYCSPDEVVFLTSRDAYEPHYVDDRRYFEPATFYDEFAKEWQDRRLPMRQEHRPDIRAGAVDVYRFRQEPNGGERSAIAARRAERAPTRDLDSPPRPRSIVCVCTQIVDLTRCLTIRSAWWSRCSECSPTRPACRCCGRWQTAKCRSMNSPSRWASPRRRSPSTWQSYEWRGWCAPAAMEPRSLPSGERARAPARHRRRFQRRARRSRDSRHHRAAGGLQSVAKASATKDVG